jgi:hypothetical protein
LPLLSPAHRLLASATRGGTMAFSDEDLKEVRRRVSEGERRLAALEWSIEAAERQGFSTALLLEALETLHRSVDLMRQHQALIERVIGERDVK